MMKKTVLAGMAFYALTGLYSCLGNGSEQHGTSIYPAGQKGFVEMFADQTVDSFLVVSYDSWEASVGAANGAATWFSISPNKQDVPAGYRGQRPVVVQTQPNNTETTRVGLVNMTTTYENQRLTLAVYQYGWLNITVPTPSYSSTKLEDAKAVFATSLLAKATKADMVFSVHANATLTSDVAWITVPADKQSFMPGTYTVQLGVEPNNGSSDRVGHVTLTSYGISNTVTYTQKGAQ